MPERRSVTIPPAAVLRAFRVPGKPVRLPGGQGQAFRAGNIVLKPASDDERTNWVSEFCLDANYEGFRIPRPFRSDEGAFVFQGWQAWEWISGEHQDGEWEAVVDLCIRFHQAIACVPRPAWLDRVEPLDPWTIADRVAWDEMPFDHHPRVAPLVSALRGCLRETRFDSQLIHGDFGGNVLYADGLPPAIIDFSPYWRPSGFAVGVVVADAIVWGGALSSLIETVTGIDGFDQLLARAELRRIIELDAANRLWGWDTIDEIDAHLPLVRTIVRICDDREGRFG